MAILVIDDEQDIRFLIEKFLNKAGFTDLYFASSPEKAFEILGIDEYEGNSQVESSKIELILLDIMMPGTDGIEVCERINNYPEISNIPIIMVTALTDPETLERAFNAGAMDYITKPIRRVELIARASSAIKLYRERQTRIKREIELEDALHRLEETNKKLEKIATIDELTKLPNRRLLDETLKNEWKRAKRNRSFLSVIMLDIDYFKNYNDTYGHLKGDECLQMISSKLKDLMFRPGDFVARYGGEEFIVILPETNLEDALIVAERLRKGVVELQIPHVDSKISDYVTVSLGVTTIKFGDKLKDILDEKDAREEELINKFVETADEALYEAKEKGRNKVESKYFTLRA
ncbi:diguanylate cyclase domain-containing protein [Natranaerofaba carboxydovora]|uniref:diguanylate cyclase domain-containing protein n=1 Tax=Natranaerofaba carboxydovora TaxID=2742683 RepID=UPI001F131BD8|nr:diguanylate cyclase [Natranaerofaba carboxydovora]UMZ72670.1 Phytochrome-like protein cph2 [Natranaerofaba carboxydovora]